LALSFLVSFIFLLGGCNIFINIDDNSANPVANEYRPSAGFIPLQRPEAINTFTLPVQGQSRIYEGDLQSDYPEVDWSTLDRLYIPAGTYTFIQLKGLPDREAHRPLIITNSGGQVRVTGEHYYSLVINGGSGWILSGKYDADLKMGDAGFPGHKNGYSNSSGSYGIEVVDTQASGVAAGGGASHFELEYMEISRSGFAGLHIKTDGQPDSPMYSVSIHDLYIHDVESEGMYIGNTSKDANAQHHFTHLKIYNNRVMRSGTEGIQLSHVGEGTEVYRNLVFLNAVRWKNPFMVYQDGCLQYMTRSGKTSIHHNVFIGGASALFSLRFIAASDEEVKDGDGVEVYQNYWSHSRNWFSYIHIDESNEYSRMDFHDNYIGDIDYHRNELPDESEKSDPQILFRNTNNRSNPLVFENNQWQGGEQFLQWIDGTDNSDSITEENTRFSGNENNSLMEAISFTEAPLPNGETDFNRVEYWVPYSELYEFYPVYNVDDLVIYDKHYYRCIQQIQYHSQTPSPPDQDSNYWQDMGECTDYDDLIISESSAYAGLGIEPL